MTGPMRLFFAIDLPEAVRDIAVALTSELKKSFSPNAVRWTQPQNLHITLQFMKAVKMQDLALLAEQVSAAIADTPSFTLKLGTLELFPDPARPKIISLEVETSEILTNLAAKIAHGIHAAHYPTEKRAFRGHLTLGYLNPQPGKKYFMLPEVSVPLIPQFRVEKVVLYRSQPQTGGSHYTILENFTLLRH